MRLWMAFLGLMIVLVSGAILVTFKVVWDDYVFRQQLVSVPVTVPDGWEGIPYALGLTEAIVEEGFDPDAPSSTTQRLLQRFETLASDPHQGAVWGFQRENDVIVLAMAFGPHNPVRNNPLAQLTRASSGPPKPNLDVEAGHIMGVPFVAAPRQSQVSGQDFPKPVNYRYFKMRLGDQEVDEVVDITVLTNTSDADVATVLGQVDLTYANAMLPTPDPNLDTSLGIVASHAEGFAILPPPPSVAYRATQVISGGVEFDEPWPEMIERIQNGEIQSWDDLAKHVPDQYQDAPFVIFDLLFDGSEETAARYFANILRVSGREWNGHEAFVLNAIIATGSAQSDFSYYLEADRGVAPEVIALISRLPVERSEEAAPSEAATVTQSGNCRIVGGVRRCSFGN